MAPIKPPSLTLLRSFLTSQHVCKPAAQLYRNRMPPYPYGPSLHYKQSDSGLYGGSTIQFGNNVSSKNEIKTRRSWHPNIHKKRLWSDAMGKFVQVKVQARVLRTIDKVGGLDEYLLGDKPARIKELGLEGWRLRWMVMNTGKVKERFRRERVRLGLPAEGWVEEKVVVGKPEEKVLSGDPGVVEEVERVNGDIVEEIEAANRGEGEVIDVEGTAREAAEAQKPSSGLSKEELEELGIRVNRVKMDGAILKSSLKEAWRRMRGKFFTG